MENNGESLGPEAQRNGKKIQGFWNLKNVPYDIMRIVKVEAFKKVKMPDG